VTAPGATRAPAVEPVEAAVSELRDLVFAGSRDATTEAGELRRRIGLLAARVDLLAEIATVDDEVPPAGDGIRAVLERIKMIKPDDADVLLELCTALALRDEDAELRWALDALRAGGTGRLSVTAAMAALTHLVLRQRVREAESLLLALLPLSFRTPAWRADAGGDTASTEPSRFVRRLLTAVLTATKTPSGSWSSAEEADRSPVDGVALRRLRITALIGLRDFPRAYREITELVYQDRGDARTRWDEIVVLAWLGRDDEALARLDELPDGMAPEPAVISLRVKLLLAMGQIAVAGAVAREAAIRYPGEFDVQLCQAEALAAAGQHDDALQQVDHLLTRERDEGDSLGGEHDEVALLTIKGNLQHLSGDLPGALDTLESAVAGDPASPSARIALARTLAAAGDDEQALAHLAQVPPGDPRFGEALLERARLLRSSGRSAEAWQLLKPLYEERAGSVELYQICGDLLSEIESYTEAMAAYLRGLKTARKLGTDPAGFAKGLEDTATRLAVQGRYEEALEALTPLLEPELLSVQGMALRAELLRLTMRWHDALAQARRLERSSADPSWVAGTKAATLVALNRSQEAMDVLGRPAGLDIFSASVWIAALDEVGRVTEALAVLDERFRDLPADSEWLVWATMARAQLLIDLGRHAEASRILKRALREKTEADLYEPLAVIYSRMHNPKRAVETWRQVLTMTAGSTVDWCRLEFADALSAQAGKPTDEAKDAYLRLTSKIVAESVPRNIAMRGWAALRLGDVDSATAGLLEAVRNAPDPFLVERSRLAMAQFLAGDEKAGARTLDRVLIEAGDLADRPRGRAIVTEASYLLGLLEKDASPHCDPERLALVRRRLPAVETGPSPEPNGKE
jgi:tetratricopeptide (TPR) repeat protein